MRDLGIGRTPLREAVKRLALEDLVAVMPRSGTYVTSIDAADIVHISEVRAELEAQAAELAARRLDTEMRERFRALLADIGRRRTGPDALMRLDESIHRMVWKAARNPYLAATLERYFALSLRVWYVVLDRVPSLGPAVFDHARLVEAILRGDAAAARELMRDHVIEFEREIAAAFNGD
jgi:DNA-binding GntR family transcriptional regulator